jgi:5-methylthioadenosine/S-adenosylhomocysteine deaminase
MSRILLKGGRVIARPGAQVRGEQCDILIEDEVILDVAPGMDPDGIGASETIDFSGRIIVPGFVNAHMHSWQASLRGISVDWNLMEYLIWVHGRIAPNLTPEDVRIGTLAAALGQIACGATALGDYCHGNATPEHSDAALEALDESGIRALFMHATPHGAPAQSRAEVERLLASRYFSSGSRLTLGLGIAGPLYSSPEIAEADLALGRDLGLVVSMHHSNGPQVPVEVWHDLIGKGLFGPWVNLVHANTIDDDLLERLVDCGVTFTITPEVELNDGHGHPITGRLRTLGAAPAIGIDIETGISRELTTAARVALSHQRGLDYAAQARGESIQRIARGEALDWLTGAGARALGLSGRIGAIAPGMQADLCIVDAEATNLWPAGDAIATVLHSSIANIEAVMIAGRWEKRGSRLRFEGGKRLALDLARSRERLLEAADLPENAYA